MWCTLIVYFFKNYQFNLNGVKWISDNYKLKNKDLVNEPCVLCADELGMPKPNTGGLEYGKLFIVFNISKKKNQAKKTLKLNIFHKFLRILFS